MRNKFHTITIASTLLIIVSALCSFKSNQNTLIPKSKDFAGFAVLELFTSQGCSSCPPADAVLEQYVKLNNPNIIPLAFHVDYWNNLGWADPFSKPSYSQRQRQYADFLKTQGNYTPQLIINGQYEIIGSRGLEIKKLVEKELTINHQLNIKIASTNLYNNKLDVIFDTNFQDTNSVVNFVLVKKHEITNIKRGENKGINLDNFNIVYDIKTINENYNVNKISFQFKTEWASDDFFVVAFNQNLKTGAIGAATKSKIN